MYPGRSQKVEMCRHTFAKINLIDWRQNSNVRRSVSKIHSSRLIKTVRAPRPVVTKQPSRHKEQGCTIFDAIIRLFFSTFYAVI